jgi:protein-tyrosine phosphatase
MKTVLFLCTGNYYRSRFAEELFNHHARVVSLGWSARSRALAIEKGAGNVGPLSRHAAEGLATRGIRAARSGAPPQRCLVADLESADLIVALEEAEHRPLLLERFQGWADRVTYWHIEDVHARHPADAIASIEQEVDALVATLRRLDQSA